MIRTRSVLEVHVITLDGATSASQEALSYAVFGNRANGAVDMSPIAGTRSGDCSPAYSKPCVFPFVYSGVTYNGCTTKDNNGQEWCATSIQPGGTFVSDQWKNCCNCPCVKSRYTTCSNGKLNLVEASDQDGLNIKIWKGEFAQVSLLQSSCQPLPRMYHNICKNVHTIRGHDCYHSHIINPRPWSYE